jgi:hypothetical protein
LELIERIWTLFWQGRSANSTAGDANENGGDKEEATTMSHLNCGGEQLLMEQQANGHNNDNGEL